MQMIVIIQCDMHEAHAVRMQCATRTYTYEYMYVCCNIDSALDPSQLDGSTPRTIQCIKYAHVSAFPANRPVL